MNELKTLVSEAKSGNKDAFGKLYEETKNRAYFVAARYVDETSTADILQDAYIAAMQGMGDFDEAKPFEPWLHTIVRNKALDLLKKKKPVSVDDDTFVGVEDNDAILPAEYLESEEKRRAILAIIDKLPDTQRIAVVLYYLEGKTTAEIAELMNCSVSTVTSRLQYARKAIREAVLVEEKKGNKLYGVLGTPFLTELFKREMESGFYSIPPEVSTQIPNALMSSAASGGIVGGASMFSKIAAMSVKTKAIIAGICAVVVVGGIAIPLSMRKNDDHAIPAVETVSENQSSLAEVVPVVTTEQEPVEEQEEIERQIPEWKTLYLENIKDMYFNGDSFSGSIPDVTRIELTRFLDEDSPQLRFIGAAAAAVTNFPYYHIQDDQIVRGHDGIEFTDVYRHKQTNEIVFYSENRFGDYYFYRLVDDTRLELISELHLQSSEQDQDEATRYLETFRQEHELIEWEALPIYDEMGQEFYAAAPSLRNWNKLAAVVSQFFDKYDGFEDKAADSESANDTVKEMLVRITADSGLRLRAGPGSDYDIIDVIDRNKLVEELEHSDSTTDWIYVFHNGNYGWINTEFITYVDPADVADAAESAANWFRIYYDYLSSEMSIGDYMSMYGETQYYAHTVKDEKRLAKFIGFVEQVNGFDYPIMVLAEFTLEKDNYTINELSYYNAYLIKDGRVTNDLSRAQFDAIFRNEENAEGWGGWNARYGNETFVAGINGRIMFLRDLSDGEGLDIRFGETLDPVVDIMQPNMQLVLSWLENQV